jgi:hypothetical protein
MQDSEIKITGDMYANSPEEFRAIKSAALKLGYTGEEMRSHPDNKVTWRGQFLKMREPNFIRKGKCGYCNSLIDVYGIYSHDRKCECCGKIIYKKYEKGGLLSFIFQHGENGIFDDVTLRIHSLDVDKKIIRFEPEIPRFGRYGNQKRKKTLEILERHKHDYVRVQIGKKSVYSFYYPFNGCINELTKINTTEVRNRKGSFPSGPRNCSVVNIMFGVEYSEHTFRDEYPYPETFHIYRDWKVEKSISELCSRANISSRPEYYSGRPAGDITETHLTKLHELIKKFKGDEAASNFVEMIKGTQDFAATSLVKRILKLASLNYKWDSKLDEEQKQGDNIELDGTPMQAMATMMSVFSKTGLGAIITKTGGEFEGFKGFGEVWSDINGRIEYSRSCSIKTQFLNSINK